ncbi:LysR family transcriptional regulator [Peribacillus sp. NPDC094092]|uniref:LysR family transcriptional regulator n=1 Tax=Peribacillus sp. NPDC094092 TaxID=3390611 RepID=UPI003CFE290F
MNAYFALLAVLETGSFTSAAKQLGYTQSAVSQLVHTVEADLETQLIIRSRTGVTLTPDGEQYLPFIKSICHAIRELHEKKEEMQGLERGTIRIGTFSSVACHWLPQWMKEFKILYPNVQFEINLGDYTDIENLIKEGVVDFGFVNPDAVTQLEMIPIQQDEMLACLPSKHHLAMRDKVLLQELLEEPYILLDEGAVSEPLNVFHRHLFEPKIEYRVQDDYAIMSMIEQGLGLSILPSLILERLQYNIVTKSIEPQVMRTISIAFKEKSILPITSRYFIDFIVAKGTDSVI